MKINQGVTTERGKAIEALIRITGSNMGMIWAIIIGLVALQTGCMGGGDAQASEQKLMQLHVDSLWAKNKEIKSKFRLKVDELKERKTSMMADLQKLKFANPAWTETQLTEDQRIAIRKWEAISRIYKHMVERYEHAVMDAEELFYRVKAMEKMVNSNQYSGKKEQFKKDYLDIKSKMGIVFAEANEIDIEIGAVEPDFHRLDPIMAEIMEKAEADKKINSGI